MERIAYNLKIFPLSESELDLRLEDSQIRLQILS